MVRGTSANVEELEFRHCITSPARYEMVSSRVQELENQVHELTSRGVGSLSSAELGTALPPDFTQHKLGLELEKPLSFIIISG
jgi:hypothetical protein